MGSWNDAFDVKFDAKAGDYAVSLTGAPFRCLSVCRLDSHGPAPSHRVDPGYGTASRGNGEQELDAGCRVGGHGGSWLSWRDPGQCERPVDVVGFAMIPFLYVVAELAVGL